jgi:uncharacterized protein
MYVVLYGATGNAGSRILAELVSRGHQVTAVVRNPAKLQPAAGLYTRQGDLSDTHAIATAIKGADAVISAYAPPFSATHELVDVVKRLILAVQEARVSRLLVVGGAGSLEVAPGVKLIDSPHFPEAWKPIAAAHEDVLEVLKGSEVNWTYLSPAAFFEPGRRTGQFRLGKDQLISNEEGDSRISMEDYAIAIVDELEKPQHMRERFTVGY